MIDSNLVISDNTDIGIAAGTAVDTFDLGLAGYGPGNPVRLKIQITEALASAGSATLAISITSGATEGTDTITLHSLAATAYDDASLALGKTIVDIVLPDNVYRWIEITYTIGTATTTAGTAFAWLEPVA